MKEPSVCPACGSDAVVVTKSGVLAADARGRWRYCRACGQSYTSIAISDLVGKTLVTVETVATLRPQSVWELRQLVQKIRTLL